MWNFLAPLKAHNRADGAAGHLKTAERMLVHDGYIRREIPEWAFAAKSLTKATMIHVDYQDFEGLLLIN